MKKWQKMHTIRVCKLYIYKAVDLKLGMLVYIINQHVHVHLQVSITLHNENMADFVISYNKKDSKLSVKIHISKLNYLKFSENVYFDKANLKI